jgi:hypothetical protein
MNGSSTWKHYSEAILPKRPAFHQEVAGALIANNSRPTPPRACRAVGVRMITSSSAAVGSSAIVASKSALVAFIFTAPNALQHTSAVCLPALAFDLRLRLDAGRPWDRYNA